MLALGIDPGTRNLGWGLVRRVDSRLVHVAHGVIRASATLSLAERLCQLADELEQVIADYQPALGSVEQLFFHKDPQAAAKLGHARGVILLLLARRQIEIVEHAPARVKRTITGNGQATKAQVAHMVRAILAIDDQMPEDASDALAIAITGLRAQPSSGSLAGSEGRRSTRPAHQLAELRARVAAQPRAPDPGISEQIESLLKQAGLRRA